jgi:hypothetical protein
MVQLEFWPDYGGGPLWEPDGTAVDLASLALPEDLCSRVQAWNARYEEARLPFEANDVAWLAEGKALLAELRHALSDRIIVVTEPGGARNPTRNCRYSGNRVRLTGSLVEGLLVADRRSGCRRRWGLL